MMQHHIAFRRLVCCLGFALGLSSASLQAQTPESEKETPPPAIEADTTSQYVIGPGDTLQVFVWRNPELTVTVPVRPDGKISTPLVEDLTAVGKTPAQLARDIETVLAEYVRGPKVNIIVSTAVSAFSQVKVIGQVRSPQALPYRAGMTVLDAILQVGGLTEFAAGDRARLVRKDEKGEETRRKIHVNDIVTKGRMEDNVALKPGDVLIIPKAAF